MLRRPNRSPEAAALSGRPPATNDDRLRTAHLRAVCFLGLAATAAACSETDGPGPASAARGYYMGFAAMPPKPEQAIAVRAIELWSRRADIAIVHENPPWARLLAGLTPDPIFQAEKDGLIGYYRSRGFKLVFVADATDGLARDREAPELRAAGRSLTEPAIQQLYRDYILAFVRRYSPEYVGLAAETNLIRLAAPADVYRAVVDVANAAAHDLRALSAPPRLFVSVQVEVAWGKLGGGTYRGVEQDFQDFPGLDLLGLSSYPYFGWSDPNDLPLDYYARLLDGRSLPALVVEGGWASGSGGGVVSSPEKQARYLARQSRLLAEAGAIAVLQLTPTDLDLSAFPLDLVESLRPFATLGVVDAALAPKPALGVWDSLFAIRRQ